MESLARTFHALPKCTIHPGALLTSEGACPTCERTAFMSRVLTEAERKQAAKDQTLARVRPVSGDRRRNVSAAEAARLGGAL